MNRGLALALHAIRQSLLDQPSRARPPRRPAQIEAVVERFPVFLDRRRVLGRRTRRGQFLNADVAKLDRRAFALERQVAFPPDDVVPARNFLAVDRQPQRPVVADDAVVVPLRGRLAAFLGREAAHAVALMDRLHRVAPDGKHVAVRGVPLVLAGDVESVVEHLHLNGSQKGRTGAAIGDPQIKMPEFPPGFRCRQSSSRMKFSYCRGVRRGRWDARCNESRRPARSRSPAQLTLTQFLRSLPL